MDSQHKELLMKLFGVFFLLEHEQTVALRVI